MGLRFLDGRSWSEVTREERVFCERLYARALDRGARSFVQYINDRAGLGAVPDANWELAYEICFYRDLWQHRGRRGELFSPKRTFDLCVLSDDHIIVIEAKAQQSFDEEQVAVFARDKEQIIKETGVARVSLVGLASSQCVVADEIQCSFDGPILTWKDLAAFFDGDALLLRADAVYEKPAFVHGRNCQGKMTGTEIVDAHAQGRRFFVGRGEGGVTGPLFAADVASGRWRHQVYETNDTATAPPQPQLVRQRGVRRARDGVVWRSEVIPRSASPGGAGAGHAVAPTRDPSIPENRPRSPRPVRAAPGLYPVTPARSR